MNEPLISIITSPGFSQFAIQLGYFGIFLWFISIDQFTPIPEEVTLLSIGYLCGHGVFNPFLAGIISLTAFLIVDSAYYFLARSGNNFFNKIYKKFHRPYMDKYKKNIEDNLPRTLIILCFIPRMRMFGPISVGLMKLPFPRFILFDFIGISIFTALYISFGAFFHKGLESSNLRHEIFIGAMLVLAIVIFIFIRRAKKEK
ncbi:MAG TPA: DedA family protein [Bacteroidia bacterium]|nr:DedA family protein [Bacteroidia bacterium]